MLPTLYLSHGGGPLPLLGDASHASMVAHLRGLRAELGRGPEAGARIKAILVVSAHWETQQGVQVSGGAEELLFDYGGFPPESYEYKYRPPAAGQPLYQRTMELLEGAGAGPVDQVERGFDHGVFVPLMLAFPEADVPVVQVSLLASMDPAALLRIGEALAPLRSEGVLLVGSGSSYHNMGGFRGRGPGGKSGAATAAAGFDGWLTEVASDPRSREQRLSAWEDQAPHAREVHPREEHLAPLFVVAGAAQGEPGTKIWHEPNFMAPGIKMSSFRFGGQVEGCAL